MCDLPGATTDLIQKLQAKGGAIEMHAPGKPHELLKVLGDVACPLIVVAGLLFPRSRAGGGPGGGMPGAGNQNKAEIMVQPETGVKCENVTGFDEAKEEFTEIVDFLKAPERPVQVGAKISKGVGRTGPPGGNAQD